MCLVPAVSKLLNGGRVTSEQLCDRVLPTYVLSPLSYFFKLNLDTGSTGGFPWLRAPGGAEKVAVKPAESDKQRPEVAEGAVSSCEG